MHNYYCVWYYFASVLNAWYSWFSSTHIFVCLFLYKKAVIFKFFLPATSTFFFQWLLRAFRKALKFRAVSNRAQPGLRPHIALLLSSQSALSCILPPGLCMCCSPAQKALLSSPCQCIPQSSLVSMFCAICSSFKVLPSVLISPVPSCFACLSSYLRRGKLWGRMWLLYVLNMCMCWNILHEQT